MYISKGEKPGLDIDSQIDRYLKRQLNDEESIEFEILMMDDEILFENVQIAQALQNAIKDEQHLLLNATKAKSSKFINWFRQPQSMVATALMASLLLFNLTPDDVSEDDIGLSSQSFFVDSFLILENTRGQPSSIEVLNPGPHLIQIDVGVMSVGELFEVSLLDANNGQIIYLESGLTADGSGWLRLLLNENVSGDYSLELAWVDDTLSRQSNVYKINFNAP